MSISVVGQRNKSIVLVVVVGLQDVVVISGVECLHVRTSIRSGILSGSHTISIGVIVVNVTYLTVCSSRVSQETIVNA